MPKALWRENDRYSQAEGWSDPVSEGRRRSDIPIYSPTTNSTHPRTPPTPAPSEDKDSSQIGAAMDQDLLL